MKSRVYSFSVKPSDISGHATVAKVKLLREVNFSSAVVIGLELYLASLEKSKVNNNAS